MSLIQKKNLRARKGKQKWRRNIDTSELENKIFEKSTSELHRQNALKKISKTVGFRIDSAPTQKVQAILPADRFKKKKNDFVSKVDSKRIKKISKANLVLAKTKKVEAKSEGEIYDAWEEENSIKKNDFFKNEIQVPLPHPGQSYNPSFKDHQKLLEEIVENEKKKEEIIHKVSNKVGRKTEKTSKKKTLSEKKLQNIEKDKFINLKNIKKELEKKDKVIKQTKTIRKQRKEEKETKIKAGLIPPFKGKEEQIPEFQLETEFASSLTKLKPVETLTSETYKKINRRERGGDPFAKRRKSKIPKFKFHNKEKKGKREEKELGQRFNVYDY